MLCSSFRSGFDSEAFLGGVHRASSLRSRLHSKRLPSSASSFHSAVGSTLYSGLPGAYNNQQLLRVKPDKKKTSRLPIAFLGGFLLGSRLPSALHSAFRSCLRSDFRSCLRSPVAKHPACFCLPNKPSQSL
jgi:hypothetical protein